MLNKYFSSVFNTTSDGDNIDTCDINANETNNALVDIQDATTESSKNNNDNRNGSVSNTNNNENTQVLNRQNCIQENVLTSEHTLKNYEITTEDVLSALNKMKTNKSPGPDDIYPKIVKETKNEILGELISLFNKSISQGSVLADWKRANVTPIFKKGTRNISVNHRPISLTFVVGKMLESIIRDKIVSYLELHSLMRDSQHCFRHKRSCLSNFLTFYNDLFTVHDISRSLDIVYIDFQKAFDKVPHNKLMFNVEQLGIVGKVHNWIEN